MTKTQKWRGTMLTAASLAFTVGVWYVASLVAGRSPVTHQRLIPTVADLVGAFPNLAFYWHGGLGVPAPSSGHGLSVQAASLALAQNSLATLARLLAGLTIGIAVSALLASVLSWSTLMRRMFLLPAHAARMLPLVALAPLFSLWFGTTERGAIFFVAFASFAIVFINALTAIASVPAHYEQFARSLGVPRLKAYVTVRLPAALPGLRGAVLLALGFGWSMVIASEFLGQTVGLGNIVNRAQEFGQTDTLAVIAVVIMFYGALSYRGVAKLFDWLVGWTE